MRIKRLFMLYARTILTESEHLILGECVFCTENYDNNPCIWYSIALLETEEYGISVYYLSGVNKDTGSWSKITFSVYRQKQ